MVVGFVGGRVCDVIIPVINGDIDGVGVVMVWGSSGWIHHSHGFFSGCFGII